MKILEKIFSIRNNDIYKIITILGIKIKRKNSLLILKKEIENLKKENKKQQHILDKRFEQFLYLLEWNKHTNKILNKLIELSEDSDLKENQIKFIFKNIHKNNYDLNLSNPKTFNEKIQWLSLHYYANNNEIHNIVDKYQFKNYIKEKLGDGFTIPLLGKWDKPCDIDYDSLPERFVLKSNWGGDDYQVKIIRDRTNIDIQALNKELERWISFDGNAYYYAFNGSCKNIKPCIFAEEFVDTNNNWMLDDYKFFCFNGKFQLGYVDVRIEGEIGKIYYFDKNWNLLPIIYPGHEGDAKYFPPKPANLDEIIKIAETLAKDFPFARVDFFITKNKLYVGEITFTPSGGLGTYKPVDYDYKMGEMLDISYLMK